MKLNLPTVLKVKSDVKAGIGYMRDAVFGRP